MKIDELELYPDNDGQITFNNADNYYPTAADYGKIPNRFIERYGNVSYLANLGMMLAIQNLTKRNKQMYVGTAEGQFFQEVKEKTGTDYSDGLVACIPIQQFLSLYELNTGGRVYNAIDKLYNGELLKNQWQILYEDKDIVASTSVLTGTMYNKRDKCMYMKFNPDLESIIINIKKDYAMIPLPILGKLREDYITNMYQLFKKNLDQEHSKNRKYGYAVKQEIKLEFDIDYFYFIIGLYPVDLTSQNIKMQEVVQLLKIQDYLLAASKMKEPYLDKNEKTGTPQTLVERFGDKSRILAINDFNYFKRHYLDKAFKRINGFMPQKKLEKVKDDGFEAAFAQYAEDCRDIHPTDIHFRYEFKRGRRNKISSICFYVSKASDWNNYQYSASAETKPRTVEVIAEEKIDKAPAISSLAQMKIVIAVAELLQDEQLTDDNYAAIAKAANWDIQKVKVAYEILQGSSNVNNRVGFLIKALKQQWQAPPIQKEPPNIQYPREAIQDRFGIEDLKIWIPSNTYELQENDWVTFEKITDVAYNILNSTEEYITIKKGVSVPAETIKSRILSLDAFDVADALVALRNTTGHESDYYYITALYNRKIQSKQKIDNAIRTHNNLPN